MDTTSSSIPVIEVKPRQEIGTRANNRLRAQGLIPTVVYHRGEESLNAAVSQREFLRIASTSKSSQVFALQSSDSRLNGKTAIVKDIARDFVKGQVLHVDFQSLKEDEEIVVEVSIKITGEAYGVKNENGILTVAVHEIAVRCLPRQIPSEITIDVSDLHVGQSIHAGDVPLPAGVKLADDAEETIISVVAMRVAEEAAPAATAGAATTEGEGAAAAAAAPAADAGAAAKKDKK
ncbi:MAG: 50S ribosomal protein L25 [Deltaproteobacteria bacterium]|nr:50S ribosomal protein L25 [Deltaproteobacteria bacterium]